MIFGVEEDAEKATRQLTIFGKKWVDVKSDLQKTDTSGIAKIGVALDGVRIKSIAAQAGVAALNAVVSFGLSLAISWAASSISKWANAEKEAAKEAEELRQKQAELRNQTLENAKAYDQEEKELGNVISQYVNLVSSVDDVNSIKGKLSDLQDQIISKYGDEADGIDLVNGKLKENIALLFRKSEKEEKDFLRDNRETINTARDWYGVTGNSIHSTTNSSFRAANIFDSTWDRDIKEQALDIYEKIGQYLQDNYKEIAEYISPFENVDLKNGAVTKGYEVQNNLTVEQTKEAIDALVDSYEKVFSQEKEKLIAEYTNIFAKDGRTIPSDFIENFFVGQSDSILDSIYDWQTQAQEYYDILSQTFDKIADIDVLEEINTDSEAQNKILSLLETAKQLNQTLNSSTSTIADKFEASLELDKTVKSLQDIANQYPAVSNIIESSLSGLGVSFTSTTATIESAQETWAKSLEETEKGILSNVDKITSAMSKLISGEGIDEKSAWEIINLDDNKMLSNIGIDENGKYVFDLKQLIALKDELINKEIEQRQVSIETAKAERATAMEQLASDKKILDNLSMQLAAAKAPNSLATNIDYLQKKYDTLKANIESNTKAVESYNYSIRNETLLVESLRRKLGELSDTTEILKANIERLKNEVSDLEKEADARLKAQEYVIDGIIEEEEKRLKALEDEKDALDKQVEALEKQEEEIKDIISNYEKVADIVQDTIQAQIDEIEKERKAVEDSYNERIDLLKQENEERNNAIEYQEKLNALENAKNNKVRVYDQERGFVHRAKTDDVTNAQNDLANFENERAIEALEKERDEALKGFDNRTEELENYSNAWKETLESITNAEDELLAVQILGSNWREKITSKDMSVLNKFSSEYKSYNNNLTNIISKEIANLKKAVTAKDEEIKAKQEQINVWKEYKTEVQDAANKIKSGLEEYVKYLNTVKLNENSTNAERLNNLTSFSTKYSELIGQITSYNTQIDEAQKKVDALAKSYGDIKDTLNSGGSSSLGSSLGAAMGAMNNAQVFAQVGTDIVTATGSLAEIFKEFLKKIKINVGAGIGATMGVLDAYAEGGVNTKTGVAWLDGTSTRPEIVLNNADASKLYNMLHSMPNVGVNSLNNSLIKSANTSSSNSAIFNIQHMDINGVQNPVEFAREFKKNINEYWNTKLTESKVY